MIIATHLACIVSKSFKCGSHIGSRSIVCRPALVIEEEIILWDLKMIYRYVTYALGLNYVWVLEGHGIAVNMLKALVHQISLDQFIQKWRSEVDNSSRCLCYRLYKQDFSLESYLLKLPPRLRIPLLNESCLGIIDFQ